MKSAAFRQWQEKAKWQKQMRAQLRKAIGRMRSVVVASCFRGWAHYTQTVRRTASTSEIETLRVCCNVLKCIRVHTSSTMQYCALHGSCLAFLRVVAPFRQAFQSAALEQILQRLQADCAALRKENDRMRRDNERFVRIIDSGEWGRGRVAELVQAGQVLQQERDQLRQLMGHLRSDYESVERAKVAQQEELMALKQRMKKNLTKS